MSEPVPVGAGSGSRLGVLPYLWSLTMPSSGKGGRDLEMEILTMTPGCWGEKGEYGTKIKFRKGSEQKDRYSS